MGKSPLHGDTITATLANPEAMEIQGFARELATA